MPFSALFPFNVQYRKLYLRKFTAFSPSQVEWQSSAFLTGCFIKGNSGVAGWLGSQPSRVGQTASQYRDFGSPEDCPWSTAAPNFLNGWVRVGDPF